MLKLLGDEKQLPLVTPDLIQTAEDASPTCLDLYLLTTENIAAAPFEPNCWHAVKESLRTLGLHCPLRGLYVCAWQGKPALRVRLELADIKALHALRGKLMGDGSRSSGTLLAGSDSSECALVTFHSSRARAAWQSWSND